jgi:aminoglycoside phosphotransferase family enzyme/predicted kinase
MDLVRALLDPAAYPEAERPDRIELVETHISWLFFAGRFVYKVKKPVSFGFLDFTTLERRHRYCDEEWRLNQRLSPDVYLGVASIGQLDGRYRIGQEPAVDWAVKMRRLPGDRWLSRVLDRGEASPALMRRIARRIAGFHAEAGTSDHVRQVGGIATVRFNTAENFAQTREYIGITVEASTYDRVSGYTQVFLEDREELFARRERDDRIRDCHGDLHADQICVENGIAFIDCIEFNERFRYGDVAADIAFPAMDIDYHGHPELSAELVREYVTASGDAGVLELLDFFKCYRAFTRGKVRSFRLRQALPDRERAAVVDQASRYFDLAGRYARMPGPALIALSGLMGSGKTSLGQGLAPRLGADLLSSDVVRKELAGIGLTEAHHDAWSEGLYSEGNTKRTYDELHERAANRLRAGAIVVLDGSYRSAKMRAAAREVARTAGAPFLLVELDCPDSELRRRLAARSGGPSDGRLELLDRQRREFEPADELPARERLTIDTSGPPADVVLSALRSLYRWRLSSGGLESS